MTESVRFGILGTGKIAQDFSEALNDVAEAKLVAVGSRSVESALRFGKEKLGLEASQCYGSYEELAKAPEVEMVYIASPHAFHYEHTMLCLNNGKNVLCEKAVALNAGQLEEMIALAKEKGLFFMEALWSRYLPAYRHLAKIIPDLGPIRYAKAVFGFTDPGVDRLSKPELGGGALLDIGVYAINLCLMAFSDRPVTKITAEGNVTDQQVDTDVSCALQFDSDEEGKKAFGQFYITFQADPPAEALIVGKNGWVKIHAPFWCATKMTMKMNDQPNEKEVKFALPASFDASRYNFTNSVLLQYEARHACTQLREGAKESALFGWDNSRQMMSIMDTIREQVGIVYPSAAQ